MRWYRAFVHGKDFLIHEVDPLVSTGFYTGFCVEACNAAEAVEVVKNRVILELIQDYGYQEAEGSSASIVIEELEQIPNFDNSYNIGRVFYVESEHNGDRLH